MTLPFTLNPLLQKLPVYQPGRPLEEVARELGLPVADLVKMASNENPLGPSPAALAALRQAASQVHYYPDGNAFYLKEKLAQKLGLPANQLVLGNGSNELLEFIGHALLGPGDEVVVSQYCFAVYPIVAHLFGAKLTVVPAKNYGHDLPAMLAAVNEKTKVVFVANPNNPTGTLAPPEAMRQMLRELPSRVLLVLDEAYIEFIEEPPDWLPLVRQSQPNLVLLRTFSKIYGLAGLRVGYGAGHPEFIAALEKIREPFNTNLLAQAAAVAALDDTEHVTKTRLNNQVGRKFFEENFRRHQLEYIPSHANFVLVRVGDGQRVFVEMQKLGIITRPLDPYNLGEWLRISVGTPPENERCWAALLEVLGQR